MTIEDIILDNDRRGISHLRPYVPADFCDRAARLVLDNPGTAFIVTGFYILDAGMIETDGPPGAIAIGNALEQLGYKVAYVTDSYGTAVLEATRSEASSVIDFPIADDAESEAFAQQLISEHGPSVIIAIERCGFTHDLKYRNMRGRDITQYTARTDYLFRHHDRTVGIGDGGNEIGMGNVANEVTTVDSLVKEPCVTEVSELILASVSNWGGYRPRRIAVQSLRQECAALRRRGHGHHPKDRRHRRSGRHERQAGIQGRRLHPRRECRNPSRSARFAITPMDSFAVQCSVPALRSRRHCAESVRPLVWLRRR